MCRRSAPVVDGGRSDGQLKGTPAQFDYNDPAIASDKQCGGRGSERLTGRVRRHRRAGGGREAGGAGLASVDPSPAPGAVPASPAPRPPGSSTPNNGPARAAVRLALADNSRPESSTVTRPTSWQVKVKVKVKVNGV